VSDEELLLRAHMPAEQVDAMIAAGPAPRHYNPGLAPVLSLLRELGSRPSARDLAIAKPGLRLSVRRSSEGTLSA
jgi:oxaloacetate decarboxylase alpha subunit